MLGEKMKHNIFIIYSTAILGVAIFTINSGCSHINENEQEVYSNNSQLPSLPNSAMQSLLDGVGIYSIANLEEIVYLGGNNKYIGIAGAFGVNWGAVLHYSFVLKKNPDEGSWKNADIYKWLQSDWVIYRDKDTQIIDRDIRSVTELLSLPEMVFTNLLIEVEGSENASGWSDKELKLLESRKKHMLEIYNIKNVKSQ
jgi:hypothetical protein